MRNFTIFQFLLFFFFKKSKKQLLVAQLYYMVSLCARGDLNPLWGYRDLHHTKRPEYSRRPLNKWKFGSISKVKWMTVKFLRYPKGKHQLVHKGITPPPPHHHHPHRTPATPFIGAYGSENLSSECASAKQSLAHFSACRGCYIISTRDPLTSLTDYGLGVTL